MNTTEKRSIPPYTTYRSFTNLVNDLRENGVPDHITRSVVKGSNSAKSMMLASLKSLDLIDSDYAPTETLRQLIDSESDYSKTLADILRSKYTFLFDDSIDLSNTTTEKVCDKFKDAGASGSTISKCMSFFLSAAKDAGIEVSSRVKSPTPKRSPRTSRKNKPKDDTTDDGDSNGGDGSFDDDGMERITVPLRGMNDGVIYFPSEMDEDDARNAVKMAVFILNNFYGIDGG